MTQPNGNGSSVDKRFIGTLAAMLVVGGGSGFGGTWLSTRTTGSGVTEAVAILNTKVETLGGNLKDLTNALERGTTDRFTGAQGKAMNDRIDGLKDQITELRIWKAQIDARETRP